MLPPDLQHRGRRDRQHRHREYLAAPFSLHELSGSKTRAHLPQSPPRVQPTLLRRHEARRSSRRPPCRPRPSPSRAARPRAACTLRPPRAGGTPGATPAAAPSPSPARTDARARRRARTRRRRTHSRRRTPARPCAPRPYAGDDAHRRGVAPALAPERACARPEQQRERAREAEHGQHGQRARGPPAAVYSPCGRVRHASARSGRRQRTETYPCRKSSVDARMPVYARAELREPPDAKSANAVVTIDPYDTPASAPGVQHRSTAAGRVGSAAGVRRRCCDAPVRNAWT